MSTSKGLTAQEIRDLTGFSVSEASIKRWVSLFRSTGVPETDPAMYGELGRPRTALTPSNLSILKDIVTASPQLYIDELREALYMRTGVYASHGTISNGVNHELRLSLKVAKKRHARRCPADRAAMVYERADISPSCMLWGDQPAGGIWNGTGSELLLASPQSAPSRACMGYRSIPCQLLALVAYRALWSPTKRSTWIRCTTSCCRRL
jgi:transposase